MGPIGPREVCEKWPKPPIFLTTKIGHFQVVEMVTEMVPEMVAEMVTEMVTEMVAESEN